MDSQSSGSSNRVIYIAAGLSIFIASGCFVILLGSNNPQEEQAAIAILSSVVTAWIAALTRRTS